MDPQNYEDVIRDLTEIEHELFDAGADLAQTGKKRTYRITEEMVKRLEEWIDRYNAETPEIRRFVLPGGSPVAAALHVARVLVRRAERRVVTLCREQETNEVGATLSQPFVRLLLCHRPRGQRPGRGFRCGIQTGWTGILAVGVY